jgi:phospholipid/cholesterol/gamma-HCH transport system substrate-binding protein
MEKQRNALRAGLFMVISLALVVFVIIAISGAGRFTQSFTTYPVVFSIADDIGGLQAGDDVRLGGLKVGSVRDISIHTIPNAATGNGQPQVVVYIDVPARFPLNTDAGVEVEKTLTGSAAVNIESFGSGPAWQSTDYLHGKPDALSQTFRGLGTATQKLNADLDKLGQTADAFTETAFTASATVHDLRIRLPEIILRYQELTAAAVRALDVIHDLLGPSTGDFHNTLSNVRALTGDLRDRLPDDLDQLHAILGKTNITVTRAADAMANVKATTGSLRDIVVGNKSKLAGIIASLKATSDNLKYASIEIRHSPWRLLYQPKAGEVANLNTYDSVRQFAEGAGSLDDAAAALRDALDTPSPDPQQVKKLMADLDVSFSRFQAVQQKLWNDIQQ